MQQHDPGWKPAISNLRRMFVQPVGKAGSSDAPNLVQLRGAYLILCLSQFLYLAVAITLGLFEREDPLIPPWVAATAVAVAGSGSLLISHSIGNRNLNTNTPQAMAHHYRGLFFSRFGNASVPSVLGLVAFLLAGQEWWVYLVGSAFTGLGLALIAPTRSHISRVDERLRAQGSALTLQAALNASDAEETSA